MYNFFHQPKSEVQIKITRKMAEHFEGSLDSSIDSNRIQDEVNLRHQKLPVEKPQEIMKTYKRNI